MTPAIATALARHFLTALSGALALKYGIDGASMDAVIGGLSAAAGIGWSIWDKKQPAS